VSSSRVTTILATLVATAICAATTASGAAAANEIAYDCKLDICLLDPANPAAVTNLTDNGETSIDEKPIWSPDGKKVAFISNFGVGGSTKNLFVMEPEAPDQGFNLAVEVTHFTSGVPIEEPIWSPDGTRLAFVYGNSESNDEVEVANSNGTTATPLVVAEHGVHPTWAPDSGKIAYSYEGHIYVGDAGGAGFPPPLTGAEGHEPVWSPDGSRIAFGKKVNFSSFDLGIVPAAGGTAVTLTSGLEFIYPSWSPSGSQVVYKGSGEQLRVVNADGSGDHPLPGIQSVSPDGPTAPSWSPDGTRIVFQGFYYGSEPNTHGVYMQNADGSGAAIPLVLGEKYFTAPAWKPNPASAPQVITPAGGSTSPLPATTKPKTVWITKRIFVTKGPDYTVIIGSYGCGGPSCAVSTEGKAKGAAPAGLNFSLERTPLRAKAKKKPRSVIVAKGKTKIPGGKSGPVKMTLTRAGAKLLEKQGSLHIAVLVTITIPGQKKIGEHRQVTVVLKQSKKRHRAA
jgi:Tol biopolymer transport system component